MTRRVFIIWGHPMFYQTLSVLLSRSDIEIAGDTSDYLAAPVDIESLKPDAVIIEESEREPSIQANMFRLLDAGQGGMKIVRLSLQDNNLWLYQRQQITIGQVEDLLKLI